jgi:hypothetical protein
MGLHPFFSSLPFSASILLEEKRALNKTKNQETMFFLCCGRIFFHSPTFYNAVLPSAISQHSQQRWQIEAMSLLAIRALGRRDNPTTAYSRGLLQNSIAPEAGFKELLRNKLRFT